MALVAMAEPEQTGELCKGTGFECLADPSQSSYKSFDVRRGGLGSVVLERENLKRGAQAMREGHMQGKSNGDVWQLPGAFIVDGEGVFRYVHYAERSSDNPPNEELLAALDEM